MQPAHRTKAAHRTSPATTFRRSCCSSHAATVWPLCAAPQHTPRSQAPEAQQLLSCPNAFSPCALPATVHAAAVSIRRCAFRATSCRTTRPRLTAPAAPRLPAPPSCPQRTWPTPHPQKTARGAPTAPRLPRRRPRCRPAASPTRRGWSSRRPPRCRPPGPSRTRAWWVARKSRRGCWVLRQPELRAQRRKGARPSLLQAAAQRRRAPAAQRRQRRPGLRAWPAGRRGCLWQARRWRRRRPRGWARRVPPRRLAVSPRA